MKVEFAYFERAYHANMLRAKASRLRKLALDRSKAALRAELTAEADYAEQRAQALDDADEISAVSEREPSTIDARRDIDSIDAPHKEATNGE